jgi:hypothetical protein
LNSFGKSRFFGCKFKKNKKYERKKISKLLTPQNWGKKEKEKRKAFLGRRRGRRLGSSLGLGCFQSRNATCRSQTADTKRDSLENQKGTNKAPVLWS